MEKETKLINTMKLRGDEYKGFAVDMKHGKPAQKEEVKTKTKKTLEEQDFRNESYKGFPLLED